MKLETHMNRFLFALLALTVIICKMQAQTGPTLDYDSNSGNYLLRYRLGDSLVEKTFVPATKIVPAVSATVVEARDTLVFSYTVINTSSSRQRLAEFGIKSSGRLFSVTKPNEDWYSDEAGLYLGWTWSHIRVSQRHGKNGIYHVYGIAPDSSVGGFALKSLGLPSITICYFQGATSIMSFGPEPPQEVQDLLHTVDRFPTNYVSRSTVGPNEISNPFDCIVFVDTLLSYTRQSVALGWLGRDRDDDCDSDEHPQDGIERNIERRLTMAKREIQRSDSVKARRDLEMLVNKVDRIWKRGQTEEKKHERNRGDWWQHRKDWVVMTSEAYALLKYNIDYLIDKLPERERHGGKEKVK
jgi:hypothetical protein